MKSKFFVRAFATVFTLCGAVALTAGAQAAPPIQGGGTEGTPAGPPVQNPAGSTPAGASAGTTFKCIQDGSGWATVAVRADGKQSKPIISWQTTEFGSEYTPKQRCEIVNEKLAEGVARNGGSLKGLQVMTGEARDGSPVLCYITPGVGGCSSSNHLMNIPRGSNPRQALANLVGRLTDPVGTGLPVQNSESAFVADFGDAVQRELNSLGSDSTTPSNNTAPVSNPSDPSW
jgi:hypothetical protein